VYATYGVAYGVSHNVTDSYIIMKKETIFISFSGGRTSAFMTQYIINSDKYKDFEKVVVFANTSKEEKETLDFVNECDIRWNLNVVWIEAVINKSKGIGTGYKVVDYNNACRDGSLFEEMISVYGIPNIAYPHCNRELKQVPMHKYVKENISVDYYTAIGIRADEPKRHPKDWDKANKKKYIYPLITDFRVSEKYIRQYWESQDFDLSLKDYQGNCDMCWKKSNRKLLTLIAENGDKIKWWQEMEEKYGTDEGYTFYRENRSAKDLVELSELPFTKAIDKKELDARQNTLFDPFMDQGESCMCGIGL
jgi:3'-phosphoadenosine 5'-phosphosulfate sulfotransferase (PAPS reductase)/FAD synthetase